MDMRDQLEKWMTQWEKAQNNSSFKPKGEPSVNVSNWAEETKGEFRFQECDTKYWRNLAKINEKVETSPDKPIGSVPQGKLRDLPTKDSLATKAGELGNTANPVYPSTRGDDSRSNVTPNWSDGDDLRGLVEMKHKLSELQGKINSHPKFGSYGPESPEIKKIQDQINELKSKIDNLSNSLSPDFVQDELS